MDDDGSGIAYIVAPDGAVGGGMGRVKDYIVQAPPNAWKGLVPRALVTRDDHGKLISLKHLIEAVVAIYRSDRAGQLALVHINMGDRGSAIRKGIIVLACRFIRAPIFLHLHAVRLYKLGFVGRYLLRFTLGSATCIIALGEVYRTWLQTELGIGGIPIEILLNGVPLDVASERRHVALSERPARILFLGTLCERKGVGDLIVALAQLNTASRDWCARFVGPGEIERYRTEARSAGVGPRTEFVGWVDQAAARAELAEADFLVLPSYDEGLPLVILEALGLGTPVIATPVGAIPELLVDGHDILLVPPGNRDALADAMRRLLDDVDCRQRLCDTGLDTFKTLFSIEAFRANLLAIWTRYLPLRK